MQDIELLCQEAENPDSEQLGRTMRYLDSAIELTGDRPLPFYAREGQLEEALIGYGADENGAQYLWGFLHVIFSIVCTKP